MARHGCPTYSRSAFKHQSLDYKSDLIRLLRILPELSHDNLIQCELSHTPVEHEHDCLSYQWSTNGYKKKILINGQTLEVSAHLWDFLKVAHLKYAASGRAIRIDYICIDQDSISELNHQIPLMKRIYSSARLVVAWFGFSKPIERAFAFWRELNTLKPQTYHETNKIWRSHVKTKNGKLGEDWSNLAEHPYWRRAWVTQEILCAKKLKLLVNNSVVMLGPVPGISLLLPTYSKTWNNSRVYPSTYTFHTYLEALCGSQKIVGRNFMSLFHLLPGRESTKPRDRIYSLCSIASDATSVTIEYNNSVEDVLRQLLEVFKESVCPCVIAYMAQALEVRDSHMLLDASGQEMPLFKIVVGDPVMTYSLKETHGISSCCMSCNSVVVNTEFDTTIFCTHGHNHCLRDTHFYVKQYWTDGNEKKYTIRSEISGSWFEIPSMEQFDPITVCIESSQGIHRGFVLYLTAGVIIRLLANVSRSSRPKDIVKLCDCAQSLTGSAASCKTINFETVPNSEPCCSNNDCLRRIWFSQDPEMPTEFSSFRISEQYIQHEIQHGTWASSSVVRIFFEGPEPWIPRTMKDPRFYWASPHLYASTGAHEGFDKSDDTNKSLPSCCSRSCCRQSSCGLSVD